MKKYGKCYIKEVNLFSSEVNLKSIKRTNQIYNYYDYQVTNIVMTRPKYFDFQSGDYLFINIPEIAKYEWHPFTISSAPDLQGKYIFQN